MIPIIKDALSKSAVWKNKKGTGERFCSCGSWKNHWMNFSNEPWPNECSVFGCTNKPTLGAHVFRTDNSKEMIVPMCAACNKKEDEFLLKNCAKCVSANKSETCEK